jgi:hypothetical protein
MLPDQTVSFESSAYIEMSTLLSFSVDGRSFIYILNNVGPNRLPWETPSSIGRLLDPEFPKNICKGSIMETVMDYIYKLSRNSSLNTF